MKKELLMRLFLYLSFTGYFVAFILHFFFQSFITNLSLWNLSIGWQREIALLNLGIMFAIIYTLKKKTVQMMRFLILVLIFISILLGTNHIINQIISWQVVFIHFIGAVIHIVIIIFGIYILYK